MDEALELVGGSRKIYKNILIKFRSNYQDAVSKLYEYLEHKAYEEGYGYAHNLKGLSGNLGAEDLKQSSYRLEVAFREKSGQIQILIKKFEVILVEVLDEIDAILETI